MNKQQIAESIDEGQKTDYHYQRRRNFPSIGDQLDMLWHAMDKGELPKIEPFYSQILDVKSKYLPVITIDDTYGAVIREGKIEIVVKWDKEQFPEYPIDQFDGDGIVEITQEVVDYLGWMPKRGDQFVTTGNEYSVPPGTFISSNS
jgi:4-hydroxyphenylpyruvate dioxygenase-like putative hemolysin